jgi:AcrR family transcriptional regulator
MLDTVLEPQSAFSPTQRQEAAGQIFEIVSGFWLSRSLQVYATLGIADQLATGPKSAGDLAAAAGADPESLYRLLRALASAGVLTELPGRQFEAGAISEILRKDQPGSLRSTVMTELGLVHYTSWSHLLDSVRTGGIAFDNTFGMNAWEYMQQNPHLAAIFDDSMTKVTEVLQGAIARAYDFSPFRKIVDVGGGQGRLLSDILSANPAARGILADRAQVIEEAQTVLAGHPARPRIQLVPTDFFHSVPAGGDLYTLKWIIHDWAQEPATLILRNIRNAMAPGAKVVLIETVLPEANTRHFGPFMDLNMLVMTGGRERRGNEYADLFAQAGLRLTRIIPTESVVCLIEAEAD